MEKKQSSIEWLASNLGEHIVWEEKIIDLIEQAKQMHKKEIVDAYCKAGLDIAHNDSIKESGLAQEYYNNTFGGNNE